MAGATGLLLVSAFLNLSVWRRFFVFKYNMDDNDEAFVRYKTKYPKTARWLLYLSFLVSFQMFRLSYSRLLGKKQFMARFTR